MFYGERNFALIILNLRDDLDHSLVFFLFLFLSFQATPMAHGRSQARGQIRGVVAGLHHSHSNARSELCQQPTLQLMATPDP